MRGGGFLVVLAGIAVAAAGCGPQPASPGQGVLAAVTTTARQSTRFTETTQIQNQSVVVSLTETGMLDLANFRGEIRVHGPANSTAEELFVPPKLYVRLNEQPRWLPVAAPVPGMFGGPVLDAFGGMTPADLLSVLRADSRTVARLGTATVGGVRVTGYRVSVDLAKAAARLPAAQSSYVRAFATLLHVTALSADVWVDRSNRVRQVRFSLLPPGSPGTPTGSRVTQTVTFYDFGVPVHVTAPPASEVASTSGRVGPPTVSGTLSPAQAAAAEQTVRRFWSAVASHDARVFASTVLPSQRACLRAGPGVPRGRVRALRIVSARPAGPASATVRFTVQVRFTLAGRTYTLFRPGSGRDWLVVTRSGGRWYVNAGRSTAIPFAPLCISGTGGSGAGGG